MKVPLVDLVRQHQQVKADIEEGWRRLLEHSGFILGPEVGEFERAFADFSGVEHCVGVASGTDALELAIRAIGVKPGNRIVVPANTFIATALAVLRAGAKPVLVDVDEEFQLIDVKQAVDVEEAKAFIPVHLFGQMAPMEDLLAGVGHLPIIEDAAQCQGASQGGRPAGTWGPLAGTSFYPGKNIGAYGDAGAVLTGDSELAEAVRRLRNWGSDRKYHHPVAGFNSRLDSMQAVVLSAKLKHLPEWNQQRRRAAGFYGELLQDLDMVVQPAVLPGNVHVYHLYVIKVPQRDAVMERMLAAGIGVGVHYPVPIHLQGALAELGYGPGDFPVAERLAGEILSLPIFPGITPSEQEIVVAALKSALP